MPLGKVHMPAIWDIESSGNPKAYNAKEKAVGLGQVRPDVTLDWNRYHPENPIAHEDLFEPVVNTTVSDWYMNTFIPRALLQKGIPDTMENRILSYNGGVGNVINGTISDKAKAYLIKYQTRMASPRFRALQRSK